MLTLVVVRRKLTRFYALPLREKFWCLPALWLLALGRLLVLLTPATFYTRVLGQDVGIAPFCVLVAPRQQQRARRIGNVIAAIANVTPWRSKCLEQALCAQFFLRWYGIDAVTFFGVARDPAAGMRAHAWVCAGAQAVTGGNSFAQFTVVRTLVSPAFMKTAAAAAGQTAFAEPTRAS